ncbi:hypothetical protein V499_00270 [Pseudogymnoascus sp. VKM F-103]|nr:hypothetical protein V499_00270 [Pseudogymnoascus sp. VKM F-103]
MVSYSSLPGEAGTILIFGSQILDFDGESAIQLRSRILETPKLHWCLETILELPEHWKTIAKAVPGLEGFPGLKYLEGFGHWLKEGRFPGESFPLPNILLTPLVVITHLAQYSAFIETLLSQSEDGGNWAALLNHKFETLGLCTGLLSAAAVSSSVNQAQLQKHGAVAIRMAMAIGAFVDMKDAEEGPKGRWKSFSVRWASMEAGEQMSRILKEYFPEAYISVVVEDKRATISTPSTTVAPLLEHLKDAGLAVAEISLSGGFHFEGNREDAEALGRMFDSSPAFTLPAALEMVLPSFSNTGGGHINTGKLHQVLTRSMLVEQSDWQQAFASLQSHTLTHKNLVVCFGSERCVPAGLARKLGPRLIHIADLDLHHESAQLSASSFDWRKILSDKDSLGSDEAVAVVGMSCQLPGAADLEEFWAALCAAKSQHTEVPADRFDFQTTWRDLDTKRKWYGNFIDDHDAFDHKFFKRSPREMSSTDPQHRLMLQAAYQAVEQSGYFNMRSKDQDRHVGCYIGVGLVDYENNIACYPPTAYAATGNLKSFAAGKISHYFGWTGPGLTIDTACSSSAVAIHQACRAILTGECSAALAGGVNVMTSPEWFQNLAGASFLSPTGQCKPFDAEADGYCRGEAVGAVFLKKLSDAIADGNQVLGVISATGVYQNQNCTAITVPNAISLSQLFRNVTGRAGLQPQQISLVECHGTGTQVGDPAEYDSVRQVFGGAATGRTDTLSLGSVKGLLGHSESASGVVALIKTLLVIAKGAIPPQASFHNINPAVNPLLTDKIDIATELKPWEPPFRAALINNYGASGSNASLVVTQAPSSMEFSRVAVQSSAAEYPFWLCGFDDQSLRRYATRFLELLESKTICGNELSLANLSFQVYRQSNRSLGQALLFSSRSIQDLKDKLREIGTGDRGVSTMSRPLSTSPVILCFGGQISRSVGLDQEVYGHVKILQKHLDHCNEICISLGQESIYPDIFQKAPITDIVKLQTMLFALQYSCANAWIDSGVQVAAVVGHSFGELTAMCVSGVLTLKDTVKMIAGRARLIQDQWGTDKGAMMAVEANLEEVEKLLSDTKEAYPEESVATIACFNSPRSFTLAGSSKSIGNVLDIGKEKKFSVIKMKRLNVTNAFHCRLVDPLLSDLQKLAEHIVFHEPKIPLERATKDDAPPNLSSTFVASHLRDPVYFNHAIQRLSTKYPSAIFLEAGSNSTITNMANRALSSLKGFHFQPVNITTDGAVQLLSDATLALWKEGLDISFWAHHSIQMPDYPPIFLPPYQFEKSRHWMELKKPRKVMSELLPGLAEANKAPPALWTYMGYQGSTQNRVRFRINTTNDKYQRYVSAHVIAQTAPICPSTFQLVIAIDALMSLVVDDAKTSKLSPELHGMDSHTPMVINDSKFVWLDAERHHSDPLIWDWKIATSDSAVGSSDETLHVSGRIAFRNVADADFKADFARYERLIGRRRCLDLLDGHQANGVIQGPRNIYKAFSDIVQYNHEVYKGLEKISGTESESAGRIRKQHLGETWLDLGLADSFCQVAGIFLNSMTDHSDNEMYISDRIDHWTRSPLVTTLSQPKMWEVFACHQRPSEKEYISDVFAFDPSNGQLVEVILGIHYVRVSKAGMGKLLSRLSLESKDNHTPYLPAQVEIPKVNGIVNGFHQKQPDLAFQPAPTEYKLSQTTPPVQDIEGPTRNMLCNLSGLEPEAVKIDSDLVDLGIDSLMGMELAREVEGMFKITLEISDLLDLTDFQSLIDCIKSTLGMPVGGVSDNCEEILMAETKSEATLVTPKVNGAKMGPAANGAHSYTNGDMPSSESRIPATVVLDIFSETKQATDDFIEENGFSSYVHHVLPKSTEMCVVYILDAFEILGCSLRTAQPGQIVDRIQHLPFHEQCVDTFYDILETARLVDLDGPNIVRTAIATPKKSAQTLLEELLRDSPIHGYDHKLTAIAGRKLAETLTGKVDGVQLIFGDPDTKEVVSGMYGKSPINVTWIKLMEDFLTRFLLRVPKQEGPIKILEMGAGTGGTTARLVPLLASLGVPFEYTITDLSASLVAAARKRFKQYPFVKFKVLDIEQQPTGDFVHSQHLVIATNCVHATHSLATSTKNIHTLLRPDGLLMMLEMTKTLPWIDLVFGLLEGWWLFDDGRKHALAPPEIWEETLQSVGYGYVDWTDGHLPETAIQRIIIALASGPRYERVLTPPKLLPSNTTDCDARQVVVDSFVEKYSQEFISQGALNTIEGRNDRVDTCVLVTGATGSLGSHLVAYFASQPNIKTVICLNRPKGIGRVPRQQLALESRGLFLNSSELLKLKVLECDTSKSRLGLANDEYTDLVNSVTNIVHNAWPMSITRPVKAFESQFKAMRNLLNLAQECSDKHLPKGHRFGFQFISSIATVGCHPFVSGETLVPEERMTVESAMPTGYGDAKLICERLLDETLHKCPSRFRPMVVRIAQIAGSKTSGHWNPVEHLAFVIKSCKTLKAIPDLSGDLSWYPVNDVAATLGELLLGDVTPYPIYHIENPERQSWSEMIEVLVELLNIPRANIITFEAWLDRVRQFPPSSADTENPAARLVEFLEAHFVRMSCGHLILDTAHSRQHSETLRNSALVGRELVAKP